MNKLLFLLFLLPSFLLCQSKVSISPIVSSLKFSNKSRVNIPGYILNDIAKVSDEIIFGVDIGYNYSHSISTHCTFTIPASSIIGGIGNFEGNTIGNVNYLMTMISLQYKLNSWRGVHFDIGSGMNNIRIINGSQAILDQLLTSSFYIPFLKVGTSVG